MRLIAIDPSIAKCGIAVFDQSREGRPARVDSLTFKPSTAQASKDRFEQLGLAITEIIAAHEVTHAVIETPDGYQKRSFAQLASYCIAVGVCRESCRAAGCVVTPVTVNGWKGTGKKLLTQLIVENDLHYSPADDNEADALGLGIWWFNTRRYREAVATVKPTKQLRFPLRRGA